MSTEAIRIAGEGFLETITSDDLAPEYQGALSSGWTTVDGANLLRAWYGSYFGERTRFPEIIDYEVSVNGRGIPDLDLVEEGAARVLRLMRRGIAFAWAALHEQRRELPGIEMAGYISTAPILVDPDQHTGNVTFCTICSGQKAYIDPDLLTDEIVVALFTKDCAKALR
jgi:hypothetical protein